MKPFKISWGCSKLILFCSFLYGSASVGGDGVLTRHIFKTAFPAARKKSKSQSDVFMSSYPVKCQLVVELHYKKILLKL